MCYKRSITYENNDSCKQRLVIVLTLHIECNFSLEVFSFFHCHSFPRSLSTIQKQQIVVTFYLSLPLWATSGKNCLVSLQLDCNLENKRRKLRADNFKMGVAATLPELSEWTL